MKSPRIQPTRIEEPPRGTVLTDTDGLKRAYSERMFITVIVCTYNRAGLLAGCLRSLADQTMPADQYEVIVVENACTDHTSSVSEEFVQAHRNFRSVREPQPGRSRAANTGLEHALGTHVAFIDDDARAPRLWVEQIARAFSDVAPAPAVVLGTVTWVYEKPPPSWLEPVISARIRDRGFLHVGRERYRLCGSNLSFNRTALLECGGFSVELGPVGALFRPGEDTEAVLRVAARHRYLWYDPAIVVEHWAPVEKMTLRYLIRRAYLSGVTICDIEGIRLCSSRIPAELVRVASAFVARMSAPHGTRRLRVTMVQGVLRLATIVGMVRGARFLR